MKIIKVSNYDELSKKASKIILRQIILKPDSVLGLATGSTPIGCYENLINSKANFSNVKSINLDEYVNVVDKEQSYRFFMDNKLFNHINIKKENTFIPFSDSNDLSKICEDYDNLINDIGPIDIQLLGIGINGHIGFNELSDKFTENTHIVKLDEKTIKSNSRFFKNEGDVPKFAITVGIKAIMDSRIVILMASGKNKAEALKKALYGPITPKVPASILQTHQNLIVIADNEALEEIKKD